MVERTPYGDDDDQSSLSALDFSSGGGGEYDAGDSYGGAPAFDDYSYGQQDSYDGGSALDAIHATTEDDDHPQDDRSDLEVIQATTDEEDEEEELGPITTCSNPPGTVTVSAFLDGSIHKIELAPVVTSMGEAQLAEEIVVIAELARRKARGNQQKMIMDNAADAGAAEYQADETKVMLELALGLPTPEESEADEAEVFAIRYRADDDQD